MSAWILTIIMITGHGIAMQAMLYPSEESCEKAKAKHLDAAAAEPWTSRPRALGVCTETETRGLR